MNHGKPSHAAVEEKPCFFRINKVGLRGYDQGGDEQAVCRLCWKNALPGGRPFPLIPKYGAVSFGRIVTGPYEQGAGKYFYVAEDLGTEQIVGYFTGATGQGVKTPAGTLSWMTWRDNTAMRIAEEEFGDLFHHYALSEELTVETPKYLYTASLGARAIAFLLHAKHYHALEMPELPSATPEFHYQVAKKYRSMGIGKQLLLHFLKQLGSDLGHEVCMQVTVCQAGKSLEEYTGMRHKGKPLWEVYNRRVTKMYTDKEKKKWGLGPVVENVTLVAGRERLLSFLENKQ